MAARTAILGLQAPRRCPEQSVKSPPANALAPRKAGTGHGAATACSPRAVPCVHCQGSACPLAAGCLMLMKLPILESHANAPPIRSELYNAVLMGWTCASLPLCGSPFIGLRNLHERCAAIDGRTRGCARNALGRNMRALETHGRDTKRMRSPPDPARKTDVHATSGAALASRCAPSALAGSMGGRL